MNLFALLLLSSPGLGLMAALSLTCLAGMAFSHQGSFDAAAVQDVMNSQVQVLTAALAAGSVIPQNYLTGATDVYLINTTNTPGTQTTRTAAQIYADLTAQLGYAPPNGFTFSLCISHQGTGTLTLAGGTGVTITSATAGTATSIATTTGRQYIVTIVNPTTVTMVNIAQLAN